MVQVLKRKMKDETFGIKNTHQECKVGSTMVYLSSCGHSASGGLHDRSSVIPVSAIRHDGSACPKDPFGEADPVTVFNDF
jgi:hypothetical protein